MGLCFHVFKIANLDFLRTIWRFFIVFCDRPQIICFINKILVFANFWKQQKIGRVPRRNSTIHFSKTAKFEFIT